MKIKRFKSGFITKLVFDFETAVAETVVYEYKDRVVVCCSTQCGCKVGCKFCGTGNKFIRNLSYEEIKSQIIYAIKDLNINNKRFQIMFMSMGEPMLNWMNVNEAIKHLNMLYPSAELLISTIGINNPEVIFGVIKLSKRIDKVGLQFSIHKSNDDDRNILIPYKDKLSLTQIRDFGIKWWKETSRPVYLNYCIDGTNCTLDDIEWLKQLFSPVIFNFTFSVICSKNENMKESGFKNLDVIREFEKEFVEYNTRIFDPEAQDDIGGGCGQLWHTQQWMNNN